MLAVTPRYHQFYFTTRKKLSAVGAEAMQESVIEKAEDERWVKLEWSVAHDPIIALYLCRIDANS